MTQELEKESKLITGQHGGKRIGAGRKKGSHGKLTKVMREKVLLSGESPLDVLMSFMRQPEPVRVAAENILAFIARYKLWMEYRFEAAKAAAPFVHPRLQAVEMPGPDKKLTDYNVRITFVEPKTGTVKYLEDYSKGPTDACSDPLDTRAQHRRLEAQSRVIR